MKNFILFLVIAGFSSIIISCGDDEVEGCTNPASDNYNELATVDDGSCVRGGCMNEMADNFDPTATTDDGSCVITGCTDELAENYIADANNPDNDNCIYARDKFIGDYIGSFACNIFTDLTTDSAQFMLTIVEDDVQQVNLTILALGLTIPLQATVMGSEINFTAIAVPAQLVIFGSPINTLIDAEGMATLSSDEKNLVGTLQAVLRSEETGAPIGSDTCAIDALKGD